MSLRGYPDERTVRDEVTDTKRHGDVGKTIPVNMSPDEVPEVQGDPAAWIRGTSVGR